MNLLCNKPYTERQTDRRTRGDQESHRATPNINPQTVRDDDDDDGSRRLCLLYFLPFNLRVTSADETRIRYSLTLSSYCLSYFTPTPYLSALLLSPYVLLLPSRILCLFACCCTSLYTTYIGIKVNSVTRLALTQTTPKLHTN